MSHFLIFCNRLDFQKAERVKAPFYKFKNLALFWALDITPTLNVPVLFAFSENLERKLVAVIEAYLKKSFMESQSNGQILPTWVEKEIVREIFQNNVHGYHLGWIRFPKKCSKNIFGGW